MIYIFLLLSVLFGCVKKKTKEIIRNYPYHYVEIKYYAPVYEAHSCDTIDGGYVLAGYTYPPSSFLDPDPEPTTGILKIDKNGNMLWADSIFTLFSTVHIITTKYGIVGLTKLRRRYEGDTIQHYITLYKIDRNGNLKWIRSYTSGYIDMEGHFDWEIDSDRLLRQTSDGGFAFRDLNKIMKTDSLGNMEWIYGVSEGCCLTIYNNVIYTVLNKVDNSYQYFRILGYSLDGILVYSKIFPKVDTSIKFDGTYFQVGLLGMMDY